MLRATTSQLTSNRCRPFELAVCIIQHHIRSRQCRPELEGLVNPRLLKSNPSIIPITLGLKDILGRMQATGKNRTTTPPTTNGHLFLGGRHGEADKIVGVVLAESVDLLDLNELLQKDLVVASPNPNGKFSYQEDTVIEFVNFAKVGEGRGARSPHVGESLRGGVGFRLYDCGWRR